MIATNSSVMQAKQRYAPGKPQPAKGKSCGHHPKATQIDCDECVIDALCSRCGPIGRAAWLVQLRQADPARGARIAAAVTGFFSEGQ